MTHLLRQDDDILQEALDHDLAKSQPPETIRRLETVMNTPGQLDHRQDDGLLQEARDVVMTYFDSHGINDARAASYNIVEWLKEAGLTITRTTPASRDGAEGTEEWKKDIDLIRTTLGRAIMATRSHIVPSQVTHALHRIEAALATPPKPAPDALREAAARVVKVWKEAPYGVTFGSFMERACGELSDALSPAPVPPADGVRPDYEAAARALGYQQTPGGIWFHPNQHHNFTERFSSADAIFERYFGAHWPLAEVVARCPVCDWPLASDQSKGCVLGDCSYRPDDPAEQERIRKRRAELASLLLREE